MSDTTKNRSAQGQLVLVEDDEAVRGILTVLLESAGWEVLTAADGPSGLQLARRTIPDVVVTDLRMPGLSGIQLAKELAATPSLPHVPIVAITSDSSSLRDAAVKSRRFVTVLSKPLVPMEFLEAVLQAIR
ncbi:MAG: response regulator [Gemmatimonadota bacterium]